MSRRICAVSALLVAAMAVGPAFAESSACSLPDISGSSELQKFLSLRAIDVIKRAAGSGEGLAALVAPFASVDLGAGDVGRPLGTGINGARMLAQTMHADTYRFLGWDYMDTPADPCSKRMVEVEFIDSPGKRIFRVAFTFDAGRVVSAHGWERSFETGRL